jgi:hypothetical protein
VLLAWAYAFIDPLILSSRIVGTLGMKRDNVRV